MEIFLFNSNKDNQDYRTGVSNSVVDQHKGCWLARRETSSTFSDLALDPESFDEMLKGWGERNTPYIALINSHMQEKGTPTKLKLQIDGFECFVCNSLGETLDKDHSALPTDSVVFAFSDVNLKSDFQSQFELLKKDFEKLFSLFPDQTVLDFFRDKANVVATIHPSYVSRKSVSFPKEKSEQEELSEKSVTEMPGLNEGVLSFQLELEEIKGRLEAQEKETLKEKNKESELKNINDSLKKLCEIFETIKKEALQKPEKKGFWDFLNFLNN